MVGIEEIAAMKAYTIGRRGSFKDYVDLYFIAKDKLTTLNNIISTAEKKYGEVFNAKLFLEQLLYTDDIEDTEIDFLREKVHKQDIEKFFAKEIGDLKL